MTLTAAQLKFRLDQRLRWFHNEWFFKWHHIGRERIVEIDMFDGRYARYGGIKFSGSACDVYWDAIARGLRKEIVEQFAWIEERVGVYARAPAETAINECANLLTEFANSVRRAAVEKDRILRGDGINFPLERDRGIWVDSSPGEIALQAEALKLALFPAAGSLVGGAAANNVAGTEDRSPVYQVALSFAGEQRGYVEAVAHELRARGVVVFYDRFETVALWGKDGVEFFHRIFAADTGCVVMFISEEYVAKKWPQHERRAAFSRAIKEDGEYVLPVRFDDTAVPGLPDTVQYLKAKDYEPVMLAALISTKIGIS